MKNNNFIPRWLIFAISAVFPFLVNGQSSNLSFDTAGIERVTLKLGVSNYEKVQLKGSYLSRDVHKPCLPVFYYKFYVPKGKVVTGVSYQSSGISQLQLTYNLLPAQHPVLLSQADQDISIDPPDPAVYGKNALYPQTRAAVFRSDFIDGDLEVVTIEFYPMQYNPVQKLVQMTTGGVLSLSTTSSTTKLSNIPDHAHGSESVGLLRSIVQNPNDVSPTLQNPVPANGLKSAQVAWTVPFYEYVVVTSRALKPAFTKFIAWKKRKGYNAGVVCIEDIIADANAVHGDPISPDNTRTTDDAGKLRAYLTAGFNNTSPKTTYALLGGEPSIVPIRYGWEADYPPATWANGAAQIPSDLYFSDLQTNWTKGSPDKTGAYYNNGGTDKFDYGAEIYVGRLLCNSESDVTKWTDKVILYEQNPGNGDYSYLSKSLFTEADGLGTISLSTLPPIFTTSSETVWNELSSDYAASSTEPHFPKGADVIAQLNNHYGFYAIFNHGTPCSFATATYGNNGWENKAGGIPHRYQVTSSDDYINDANITRENGNGFDNLTNYNYPSIIYSISCINMPYDNYDYWGVNHKIASGARTLGASFTVANSGGGPAYLGNTRDGWFGIANDLETAFFNNIASFPQVGIAEAKSKVGFYDHWTCLTHNLIGCPEMPMWTVVPSTFNGSVTENGTSATVNTGGAVADKICVMSAVNDGYFQVASNVSSNTFLNVSKPYYVTITKTNYIPFRNSLTNVYVQNKNLSSTAYLICQTVSAGYNVDASQSTGNVVIQNGANITFDATGDIILAAGFEVQLGATFEAK